MICKICNKSFGRQGGSFNKHLLSEHDITNYKDYILMIEFNNIHPLCECGCLEETTYHNNIFKKYKHGHNSYDRSKEIEKNLPIDLIVNLYSNGKTGDEISEISNLDRSIIFRILNKYSETRDNSKSKIKYKIDDTVFEKIDNEEKAYWLGFLYADGYLNDEKNTVTLALSNVDIDILYKFKSFLKSEKKIRRNNKTSSKVVIENKKIYKDLLNKGLHQKKTHTIDFPDIEDDLKRHFIRGYFDGDGCITYGKKMGKSASISIVSNLNFLKKIDNNVDIHFSYNKRHKDREDNILTITSGGIGNIIKFYLYLYDNSNIYMNRKKNKFDEWFEYYFNNIKISQKTKDLKNKLKL